MDQPSTTEVTWHGGVWAAPRVVFLMVMPLALAAFSGGVAATLGLGAPWGVVVGLVLGIGLAAASRTSQSVPSSITVDSKAGNITFHEIGRTRTISPGDVAEVHHAGNVTRLVLSHDVIRPRSIVFTTADTGFPEALQALGLHVDGWLGGA